MNEYDEALVAFIKESNRIEGIVREPAQYEIDAHREFLALEKITVDDMEVFVASIAAAPLRDEPGMDVRVGGHVPPSGGPHVKKALEQLLSDLGLPEHDQWETHLRYESLHPFMDGNGRSGRVLWLWMMGGEAPLGFLHQFYYQTLAAS